MKYHVIEANYLDDYRIFCKFKDGKQGIVDLSKELDGSIFEPLKDMNNFIAFKVGKESKTIEWENGADIAPEFLYDNAT